MIATQSDDEFNLENYKYENCGSNNNHETMIIMKNNKDKLSNNSFFDYNSERENKQLASLSTNRKISRIHFYEKKNGNFEEYSCFKNPSNDIYLKIEKNFDLFIKSEYPNKLYLNRAGNKRNILKNNYYYKIDNYFESNVDFSSKNFSFDKSSFNNISLRRESNSSKKTEKTSKKESNTSCEYKKLKSKFSIGDIEKKYYEKNHSVNSFIIEDYNKNTKKKTSSKFSKKSKYSNLNNKKNKNSQNSSLSSEFIKPSSDKVFSKDLEDKKLKSTKNLFNSSNIKKSYMNESNISYDHFNEDNENQRNQCIPNEEKSINSFIQEIENLKTNNEFIKEISGDDYEFEKELVIAFLKDFPIQISKLENALEINNMKETHILCHSLKTSFIIVGLNIFSKNFYNIESRVKEIIEKENYMMNNFQNINEIRENDDEFIKLTLNWIKSERSKEIFKMVENTFKEKYQIPNE